LVQNLTPLAIIFPTLKTSPSWKDRNASSHHYDVSLRGARKHARRSGDAHVWLFCVSQVAFSYTTCHITSLHKFRTFFAHLFGIQKTPSTSRWCPLGAVGGSLKKCPKIEMTIKKCFI
jgi:hypothetical protein